MNLFSFIKSRLSILDVVNEYVTLKRAGLYYKGSCPFHSEKTASFTVSPHKEIFYCFGCHVTGDVIAFIAQAEHCSQLEAAHHVIDRYSLQVPEELLRMNKETSDQIVQDKKHYYDLCKQVTEWCHTNLMQSATVRSYLLKRGFTEQILNLFNIGYFPGGFKATKALTAYMHSKQFLATDLIDTHILAESKQVLYSPFEERIIFPIKDHLGRHCGFGGRVFKEQDERAKYYNTRENEFFNKGSLLFGFDLAKKSMQDSGCAYMVEGYTDCMAMVQHGFPNTIATLGTACTLEHLKTVSRYITTLYLVYDGDAAGHKAMLRLAELCWETNLEPMVISLPKGDDPASFLMKGGSFQALKASAKDIFLFYIESLGSTFSTQPLAEKLRNIHKLLDIIKNMNDSLKQDLLLKQAGEILNIPFDSLKKELSRLASPHPKAAPVRAEEPQEYDLQQISLLEKKLFSVIMASVGLIAKNNHEYIIKHFSQPLRGILERMVHGQQNGITDFGDFFNTLPSSEQYIVSQLLLECEEEDPTKTFELLIAQFQKKHWKSIVHDIKMKLNEAEREENDQKVKELLTTFEEMKKKLLSKGSL